MIGRLLSAFGIRKPYSSRHAETAIPQMGVTTPEIEPYGLLSGHRPSSLEYVTDVTRHLTPKTREFLDIRFPDATYRVFLGLPPGAVGLDPETPTVVAIYPDGYASYYLNPYGLGSGHSGNTRLGYREDLFDDQALSALMRNEVTEPARSRIIEGFEDAMRQHSDSDYRFPQHPRDETMFPGKYFRLVNTVANGLPVQSELPLVSEQAK